MGRKTYLPPPPPKKRSRLLNAALFTASFGGGLATAAVVRHSREEVTSVTASGKAASPGIPVAHNAAAAEAQFQKGVELLKEEQTSAALIAFQNAAVLDASDPRPWHGMGKIYDQLFLKDKSEECYRRAATVDPQYRPSREKLAMLLYEKGKHLEAIAILQSLARETPQEPFLWGELAINAMALGQTTEAVELLEKYRAAKPRDAWGRAHLGKAYAEARRTQEAETEYRQAIALDRHLAIAHWWLGQLLVATQRESEARPFVERYQRLRQLATDEHQMQMGLVKDPHNLNGLIGLSRVQILQGKVAPSRAALERARALAPTDPRIVELDGIHTRIEAGAPDRP